MKRLLRIFSLIAGLLVLDQVTKIFVKTHFFVGESVAVIKSFFSFTYVQNPGVAFGFLASAPESWRRPLLLLIPVVACLWLLVLMWKERNKKLSLLFISYALIFTGALGNLIDRFFLGYVVDFFDFYWGNVHFPAFNIADSCITIAAFLLIIDFFLQLRKEKKKK